MDDHIDKMTETRGSLERNPSFWQKVTVAICPCWSLSDYFDRSSKDKQFSETFSKANDSNKSIADQSFTNNRKKLELNEVPRLRSNNSNSRKSSHQYRDLEGFSKKEHLLDKQSRQTVNFDLKLNKKMAVDYFYSSISGLAQNQLIKVGISDKVMLAKISSIRLQVNPTALKKEIKSNKLNDKEDDFSIYEFNRYWNYRYFYFQKFDEGIKVDQDSWAILPPEAVSDYVSQKCCGAKTIIDAFAGIGATTVKLANVTSCIKIIACEEDEQKSKFLLNNTKVYEVDNFELRREEFMKLNEKKSADVIFLNPRLAKADVLDCTNISLYDFDPSLDKIIYKALKMSHNLIMLLPPNINIESLCACMNKCAQETKHRQSSSVKIEKLFFRDKLKYILLTFGPLVQTEIKIHDQLNFIYNALRQKNGKFFKHKKVIKKVREDHGMITLLNCVRQSSKNRMNSSASKIDEFYNIIRQKKLIHPDKLQKIINDQNAEYEKRVLQMRLSDLNVTATEGRRTEIQMQSYPVMEEEKVQERDDGHEPTISQRTQSYYSHYSFLSKNQSKDGKQPHPNFRFRMTDGVQINRTINGSKQKRDGSQFDKPGSPLFSPKRQQKKDHQSRISQIVEKSNDQSTNYQKKKTIDVFKGSLQ